VRLRPSNAGRWYNCAAAPRFASTVPEPQPNDAAREGTAAAWAADLVLQGAYEKCSALVGLSHKNGWLVTDEMAHLVQGYVDLVKSRGGIVRSEEKITFSIDPLIEGVLDSSCRSFADRTLYVDDFKYGFKTVDVFENKQLLIYAFSKLDSSVVRIQLGIYQPRSYHTTGIYRTWMITPDVLEAYAADILDHAKACLSDTSWATAGPWCDHCPVAANCQSLASTSYAMFDRISSIDQREMTTVELSKELDYMLLASDVFNARKKAVEAEGLERGKSKHIPGWEIIHRKGKRIFDVDATGIKLITGVDATVEKMITPAELERRGVDKEIVNTLSSAPSLSPKLSKIPRNKANEVFKDG